jgi:hypothetical protein
VRLVIWYTKEEAHGSVGDRNNAPLAGMGFNLMLLLGEISGYFFPLSWELSSGQICVETRSWSSFGKNTKSSL